VSTIDDGSLLSVCGSALAQSATTPTSATGADELGALAGTVGSAGTVVGAAAEPVGEAAVAVPVGEVALALLVGEVTVAVPVGEAAAAVSVGEAVTVGVELFLAVLLGLE
jgi:hypothetical protein